MDFNKYLKNTKNIKTIEDLKNFLKEYFKERDLTPSKEDIEKVKLIVEEKRGTEKTLEKAKELVMEAIKELEKFPNNKYSKDLEKLAKYIVERDF